MSSNLEEYSNTFNEKKDEYETLLLEYAELYKEYMVKYHSNDKSNIYQAVKEIKPELIELNDKMNEILEELSGNVHEVSDLIENKKANVNNLNSMSLKMITDIKELNEYIENRKEFLVKQHSLLVDGNDEATKYKYQLIFVGIFLLIILIFGLFILVIKRDYDFKDKIYNLKDMVKNKFSRSGI